MTRIGVALHTFRNVEESLPAILRRVADHGLEGVEFARRVHDAELEAVEAALAETELDPIAAHVTLDRLESNFEALLDRYATLDCTRLVIPHVAGNHFVTSDRVDALATRLTELAERLDARGFTLVVHTTRAMHRPVVDEFGLGRLVESSVVPTGGLVYCTQGLNHVLPSRWRENTGFHRLVAATESAPIEFEIDTQHAVSLGQDPHRLFETAADRLFAVHLSDGIRGNWFPPVYHSAPLGDSMVDIERDIQGAIDAGADWLVGEVDEPPDPHQSFAAISETLHQRYEAD